MKARRQMPARYGLYVIALVWMFVILPLSVAAAPYAAMVMDARTGEVLHSKNADTRLHPASLTKMMTLYIAFQAVESGEISLDTKVKISRTAAAEPPSKLGLRPGQSIAFRYLIRAAAVKSANDAATAIGEALEGSEAAFARRMNRTAKALGMSRTTFKNAHGLTENGHLSTARDMTILGRHLLYDYPQYYNLFSRRTADAGITNVSNTNRRLLSDYRGADGIKTGYTRAAGFNLVASAERGQERVIATVFGGTSTAARNARVAELLDLGFKQAPSRATVRKPSAPSYAETTGATRRAEIVVSASLRPRLRPGTTAVAVAAAVPEVPQVDLTEDIVAAVEAARTGAAAASTSGVLSTDIKSALIEAQTAEPEPPAVNGGVAPVSLRPAMRPESLVDAALSTAPVPEPEAEDVASAATPAEPDVATEPAAEAGDSVEVAVAPAATETLPESQVITRISTSGGRQWGVSVGRYSSRYLAERALVTTALNEIETLEGTLRKVVERGGGYDANFLGMTRETADRACRRLAARNIECTPLGPT